MISAGVTDYHVGFDNLTPSGFQETEQELQSLQDQIDFIASPSLASLTDVDLVTDPQADNDVLAWDQASGKWMPATVVGSANRWTVENAGAFGPGFDELVPADVFGVLDWGPDYYFYQSPTGENFTAQASEGDQILCAGYVLGGVDGYASDPTQEGLWTLTGGVWVRDASQPLPGEVVGQTRPAGEIWQVGNLFIKTDEGLMEQANLQYQRAIIGQSAVVETTSTSGTVGETASGAAVGFSVVNASGGSVTRTLNAVATSRGHSVIFVKSDATANEVVIDAAGSETINGSTAPITLTSQWEWARLTCSGTGWVATRSSPDADFVYGVGFTGDLTGSGGVYNVDGTVTYSFLGFLGLPPGTDLKILLRDSPDSSYDVGYIWNSSDLTYTMTPFDNPLTFASVGDRVSINFDFGSNGPVLALVSFDGANFSLSPYASVAYVDAEIAALTGSGGITPDERRWEVGELQEEWDSIRYKLRTMPTAADLETGYDATWQVTNAGENSGTLPHTPDGIDMRAFFRLERLYRDDEVVNPARAYPFQRFREIFTQVKATATGGDLTEWALRHNDTGSPDSEYGTADWFYEATLQGAPGEGAAFLYNDGAENIGVPIKARLTHDVATQTVTVWRAISYDTGEAGIETTDDGITWYPLFSNTDARWASMDDGGMGDGSYPGGQPEPWRIGIQNNMDLAWMSVYHFGGGSAGKILDIQPSDVEAAYGTTSFVDGVGNTISTTGGEVVYTGTVDAADVVGTLDIATLPVGNTAGTVAAGDDDRFAGSQFFNMAPDVPTGWGFSNLGEFAAAGATIGVTALNRRAWQPIFLVAGDYDRASIYVATGGTSTWRLGLHSSTADGWIGTLLHDFGTVDTSGAAGFRNISVSTFTIAESGWYWTQVQVDAYTSMPDVMSVIGQGSHPVMPLGFITDLSNPGRSWSQLVATDGTSGSLSAAASTWTSAYFPTNDAPRVWIWKS